MRAVGEIAYRGGGPCEYIANVSPAKAHETIVLLDTGPWTSKRRPSGQRMNGYATCLNNAFLCAGFKPGKPFSWNEETGEAFPPQGDPVHIYFEWKEKENEIRARISDLLWNYRTVDVMQPGTLVYTGSMMIDEGPPHHKQWFGAEVDRLCVAILNTSTALIDNVEEGALENNNYGALPDRVPEIGTRVTALFSAKPLEGVTETFVNTFLFTTVIFQTWNLIDLVLLDWLLLMGLKPRFMILPGTEDMAGYRDYAFHFRKFLNGTVLTLIPSLIVTGIAIGVQVVMQA